MNSQNNSFYVSNLAQRAPPQQRYQSNSLTKENNQMGYSNLYNQDQQAMNNNNNSPVQENKIRTKAQLDSEIEKLRMKLKSVKRNSIEDQQMGKTNVQSKQYQYKENDIPKNMIQRADIKINTKESSGQKSVKGSGSIPNVFYSNNNTNNSANIQNKKVFSEEVSDRILNDLKKQTAEKVEDFIENCYSSKNSKVRQQNQQLQQQQQQQQQLQNGNNSSMNSKYLKLGIITQQVISSQNQQDNINSSGNQSMFILNQVPNNNSSNLRQSLNINTGNMYAGAASNSMNGIPSKTSATRHSQGSLPINNIFQSAFNSSYVTPQNINNNNNSSILTTANFHTHQNCESKKCTSCLKRREKSAEKVDRRKLSENKKQFLNKYNISDTRKEYSSYKEQKVQQRRFSIHTNQIQEPFNFVLQGNQDLNMSSGNVRHQSWVQQQQQNNTFAQQQQQDINQGESFLDNSWNNKVTSHVKALQQAIADNGTNNGNSSNNSRLVILNELNYSQIDHPNNKTNLNDVSSNYKSLNTTNIVDNSMVLPNNQNNQSNSFVNNNNLKTFKNQQQTINEQQLKQNSIIESIQNNQYSVRINADTSEEPRNIQISLSNMTGMLNGTSKFAGLENKQGYTDERQNIEQTEEEYQLQKETFSQVVNHYEQLLKEKERSNEDLMIKYEEMLEQMQTENEKLSEYKQQLIIMNNDLAQELQKEQQNNKNQQDDELKMKNKFQEQEIKLNTEIVNLQTKSSQFEKEKSMINKAFEYKSIECDALKEEITKLKQSLQEAQMKVEQQQQTIEESRFSKQQDVDFLNTRQLELHKTYKNQFNKFFEKIQQIKVVNDDYLMANKREFESIEKRFYEDSLLTKPSCIQSTQGDDLETKNYKLEQENKQLMDKLLQKEDEISLYKDELTKSDEMNQKVIVIEQNKLKGEYEIQIRNLDQTINVLKSNESKLIEIISQLEQTLQMKEKEIHTLKEGIESVEQAKFQMEEAAQQLQAKMEIVEEQENILEKRIIELSVSHQTSIEGGQTNAFESTRGLEIQNLLAKVHNLQIQNKSLNEELIEREKQVNILQYQNQQCQKELEELRSGLQEFETEVQEMKIIYNQSFEQEKKSIAEYYEQKIDQQQKQINALNETINRNKMQGGSFNNLEGNENVQESNKLLYNAHSDPNISTLIKKNTFSNLQLGLPPTNSKKNLNSFTNYNLIKQDSNLALNRKHNETFEETFEDGRGGSYLKLSNIIVNPMQQNEQKQKVNENQKCTFIEYMNKYTNEDGELNTDAFEKEIFQLKEKELLEEIDVLNKRYYLQEQNTQLELGWIKKQTESTTYLDHTQYKEQLDSLQKQIDSLKMIKQQLSAVNKEIDQRFEGCLTGEYLEELKQKQIEIQLNEKEITQKLEQYASINDELQLEYSKNILNISEINEENAESSQKYSHISPHKQFTNSIYKKLSEIGSCQKDKSMNTYVQEQKEEEESQ